MSEDAQHVAEMIRNGTYFKEARGWYETLYIGPVSERSFFLMVAVLAGLIALISIVAVSNLLPIMSRPGIIIPSDRVDDVVPRVLRIKKTGVPLEPAMEKMLIATYVRQREGYDVSHYESYFAFVTAHSSPEAAAAYAQQYDSRNPQSPAAVLGYNGQRHADIDSVSIGRKSKDDIRVAQVRFSTSLDNIANAQAPTEWSAEMRYRYNPTIVTYSENSLIPDSTATVQDPQLQVLSYALKQSH